ncbi:hypothetical protein HDV05_002638, partial [Chytridiales sp. JEL 0842]
MADSLTIQPSPPEKLSQEDPRFVTQSPSSHSANSTIKTPRIVIKDPGVVVASYKPNPDSRTYAVNLLRESDATIHAFVAVSELEMKKLVRGFQAGK